MRKNKFIKLIEHILVALPMLMILATTCYTIFNSNAKDSYSKGDYITMSTLGSLADFQQGVEYTAEYDDTLTVATNTPVIKYSSISIDWNDYANEEIINVNAFRLYSSKSVTLYRDTTLVYTITNTWGVSLNGFSFVYEDRFNNNNFNSGSTRFLHVTYSDLTLDKAFETSMNKFNELGFNKINFTGFFEDIFFEGQPNVYLSFVNCYLNYMLLIECAFVLPLVLYWFIHVGESILYRFEKGEW